MMDARKEIRGHISKTELTFCRLLCSAWCEESMSHTEGTGDDLDINFVHRNLKVKETFKSYKESCGYS